tara:strand:- start:18353 stop:18802 length:450 start_codon:yes stop_codon:yes gene_type:complete
MKLSRKNEKGFTIVEFMIVIAAIGVLSAIVLGAMGRSNNASVAKRVVDEVSLIAAQASAYRGADTSYSGISITELVNQGLVKSATNPYGGAYTVAANTDAAYVDITSADLSQEVCLNVAHKLKSIAADVASDGNADVSCTDGDLSVTFE